MHGWAREARAGPSCPCTWFCCVSKGWVLSPCASVGWTCHNTQHRPSPSSPPCTPVSSLSLCITPPFAFCLLQGCSGSSSQHRGCWLVCSELPEQDWTPCCERCGAAPCAPGCASPRLLKHMVTSSSSPCCKTSRSRLQVCNLRKTNKRRAEWLYLSETWKLWFTGNFDHFKCQTAWEKKGGKKHN